MNPRTKTLTPGRILALAALATVLAAPAALAHKDVAFLGISSRDVTSKDARRLDLESRDGVIITMVYDDTAADEAGLRRGDVVLRFDGERVLDDQDITDQIRDHEPGDTVTIEIIRKGESMKLEATLGAHDEWGGLAAIAPSAVWSSGGSSFSYVSGWHGRPELGVHIMELNSQLAEYFGAEDDRGVLVTRVLRRSPAEDAGIRAGDVIVRVAGDRVVRSGDISDALEGRWGEDVTVEVIRNGSRKELEVMLDEED